MPAYPKNIEKVEIGSSVSDHLDLTAIEYVEERLVGSGLGGDYLSPRTVLNVVGPVDVCFHNKWWEITVALAEDEFTALFDMDIGDSLKAVMMGDENPEIGHLAVTRQFADGSTDTRFYDKTRVASVTTTKLTNRDGKYIVEIKFKSAEGILDISLPFIDERTDHPFNVPWFLTACRSNNAALNSVV